MKTLYTSIKFAVLMLIILMSSCIKDQYIDQETSTGEFRSKLLFNAGHSATKTKVIESNVQRLDILLFKEGKLEKVMRNITSFSTTEDGLSSVEIGLNTEGTRQVYVIANLDNEMWLNKLSIGFTTIKELTSFQTTSLTKMANPPLVMYGTNSNIDFSTSQNSVSCQLYHVGSRIDIENKASNFTLLSARLINAKVASRVFPSSTILSSIVRDFEAKSADGSTHIRLYGYENDITDPQRATKVEITGSIDGVPLTYTVDLAEKGNLIPVERSSIYTVTVNDVQQNQIDATIIVRKWLDNEIGWGDAVLSFKVDRSSATPVGTTKEAAINYLYAFLSYTAADGTTSKFEKIAEGEDLYTMSYTLPVGEYSPNSSATLYVLANTDRTLGNITRNELENALESKQTCTVDNGGAIVIDRALVATRMTHLVLKPGIVTSEEGCEGVNNNAISLKCLSGGVYVLSSTGKPEDIAGYRIKLENISSAATYFTYEGSGLSEFGEYVLTGNSDGQYFVNGKEVETIGHFYPSTNVKVTVSHPRIPNECVSQYINIKSDTNNTIAITPYAYNPNYPKEVVDAGLEVYTVFNSGTEANSVRIPCLVTAQDGSLLTFCETRYSTWKDRRHTDIVVKRSTDNGKTWSSTINITGPINGGPYAFMDPTAVVDAKGSGKVFLFCCRRTCAYSNDVTLNVAYMFTSEDNGVTWDSGKAVNSDIVGPGLYCSGPGSASGIQLQKGMFAGRMIFPMRQSNGTGSLGAAIYSDNGGSTWGILSTSLNAGESQIAEVEKNQLYFNVRRGTDRYYSKSTDSGITWTSRQLDSNLPSFESGCQASVIGNANNVLLYCGPKGGAKTQFNDNRFELTLYRSLDGGSSWANTQLLYNLASGYSDMTILNDGRLAIAFECGPEKGFTYALSRPAGWMQIQVLILPKEVFDQGYWFGRK